MAETYCDLCDLPLATCVHGMPSKPEPAYVRIGPTITAKSTSPCAECGSLMHADIDEITHTEDGWVHARHIQQVTASDGVGQWEGFET